MTTAAINKIDQSEWIMALPRLVMLAIRLGFDKNVPWETKTALGGGLLYIISPIDGIPDFIPVIGQLEDILVAVLLIDGMVNYVDREIVLKHWRGQPETLDAIGRTTKRVTAIMPAFIRNRVMKKAFRKNWRPGATGPTPGATGKVVVDAQ
jgi:uncharacterized membrane protein YkvA (DUF1232 family)